MSHCIVDIIVGSETYLYDINGEGDLVTSKGVKEKNVEIRISLIWVLNPIKYLCRKCKGHLR